MSPRPGPSLARTAVFAAAVLLCAPSAARAQDDCQFLQGTGDLQTTTLSGGESITYIGTPNLLCRDGVRIRADSAVSYSSTGMQHFIGRVRFRDASGEMRADEARYFERLGRLQAEGSLFVQDSVQGYSIRNGSLVYLRATRADQASSMDVRTWTDRLRPHALLTMRPADSAPDSSAADSAAVQGAQPAPDPERPNTPYEVDADRIFLQGDTYFRATGRVEIVRDSLNAFADSAEYDQVGARILLDGAARVTTAAYDLTARTITMGMAGNEIDEVVARRRAVLNGEDMTLRASRIDMFMTEGALQRLVAVRPAEEDEALPEEGEVARPVAVSGDFELTADSIEVLAPGEQLERIHAAGKARSVSTDRDSLNVESLPEIARSDWLEGDTVIVTFVQTEPSAAADPVGDSAAAPAAAESDSQRRIDRIVAKVSARSLYRLPPADTNSVAGVDPPAIHHVVGDTITIVMAEGQVDHMDVVGQTQGIHLEPLPVSRPDSLVTDTAAVADTSSARAAGSPARGRRTPEMAASRRLPRAPAPARETRRPLIEPPHPSDWRQP